MNTMDSQNADENAATMQKMNSQNADFIAYQRVQRVGLHTSLGQKFSNSSLSHAILVLNI